MSEETLALQNSSSSEFEDVNLNEQVDLIATTFGSKPPSIPLREERMSLGIECVFKAKGAGWNGVKKLSKSQRRNENRKKRNKTILQCITDCSPFQIEDDNDRTPKNDNRTKKILESDLQALSYEQYLQYLRRCNAKTKESIEHQYLELERSQHSHNGLRKRIYTQEIEARQETFDSVVDDDADLRDITSLLSVATADQSVVLDSATGITSSDSATVVTGMVQRIDQVDEMRINRNVSFAAYDEVALLPAFVETEGSGVESSTYIAKDYCPTDITMNKQKVSAESPVEEMVSSGSELLERNLMKCLAHDTTVPTSTRTVHVPPQNKYKSKKEAKILRTNRGSSIMDYVGKNGTMVTKEVLISSHKKSPDNCTSGVQEKRVESRDERRSCTILTELRDDANCNAPVVTVETVTTASASSVSAEVQPELMSHHSRLYVSASSEISTSSLLSGSAEEQPDMRFQLSVISQDLEYNIPPNLSYESCHSSLYSKDQLSARTTLDDDANSMDNESFGLADLIPQSFSLSSFLSAKTNFSKKSTLSTEDVENCIAYTVSELGRIHSMLDDTHIEATADNMSCTSESTNGRDVLYFARQSKTEIAALQNLIEQHIDSERESGSFDIAPSVVSSKDIDDMVLNPSHSFGTMTSMKSKISLLESASMDKLIDEVNDLCSQIENRIENIVNDTI